AVSPLAAIANPRNSGRTIGPAAALENHDPTILTLTAPARSHAPARTPSPATASPHRSGAARPPAPPSPPPRPPAPPRPAQHRTPPPSRSSRSPLDGRSTSPTHSTGPVLPSIAPRPWTDQSVLAASRLSSNDVNQKRPAQPRAGRSEERRVGTGGRSRRA